MTVLAEDLRTTPFRERYKSFAGGNFRDVVLRASTSPRGSRLLEALSSVDRTPLITLLRRTRSKERFAD
jgi:hypothetical protein